MSIVALIENTSNIRGRRNMETNDGRALIDRDPPFSLDTEPRAVTRLGLTRDVTKNACETNKNNTRASKCGVSISRKRTESCLTKMTITTFQTGAQWEGEAPGMPPSRLKVRMARKGDGRAARVNCARISPALRVIAGVGNRLNRLSRFPLSASLTESDHRHRLPLPLL